LLACSLALLSSSLRLFRLNTNKTLPILPLTHITTGKALMAPYLPRDGHTGSPYSEGGALYALGLITANHGSGIQPFLTESLRSSSNPIIQHGACLGLGGRCAALN
jgi:26S proteasome regulatory subunit N2